MKDLKEMNLLYKMAVSYDIICQQCMTAITMQDIRNSFIQFVWLLCEITLNEIFEKHQNIVVHFQILTLEPAYCGWL